MKKTFKTSTAKKIPAKPKGPSERSVLVMTSKQARAFLLKPKSYCSVDLPPYFDFERVLCPVAKFLNKKSLCSVSSKPRDHEGVNYTFYSNKDGQYAWRPLQLIHPALYVELTRQMTEHTAWGCIQARLKAFAANPKIRCLSLPLESLTKRKDQAAQILNWWQGIEQASIELALDFNHVYHADITDCYASIYTHSIAWALHTKETAKNEKKNNSLIGNVIDRRLQDMQQGQTNGIPQGSMLVDLIAELVLGYADLELHYGLEKQKITEYQILRYRDDYRIFVNSPDIGERILKTLTEVLLELGLKLNASKTSSALAIITNSIKSDKKQWMRGQQSDRNLLKHLLLIHYHSNDFPNAGSLLAALDAFYQRLNKTKTIRNAIQMISVTADIGYHSPRCFPACAAIISILLGCIGTNEEKIATIRRVQAKLAKLPHNGHFEIWQQRMNYAIDPSISYSENCCKLVKGEEAELWSNLWITDKDLKTALNPMIIVNRDALKSLTPIVKRAEYSLFFPYQ